MKLTEQQIIELQTASCKACDFNRVCSPETDGYCSENKALISQIIQVIEKWLTVQTLLFTDILPVKKLAGVICEKHLFKSVV